MDEVLPDHPVSEVKDLDETEKIVADDANCLIVIRATPDIFHFILYFTLVFSQMCVLARGERGQPSIHTSVYTWRVLYKRALPVLAEGFTVGFWLTLSATRPGLTSLQESLEELS